MNGDVDAWMEVLALAVESKLRFNKGIGTTVREAMTSFSSASMVLASLYGEWGE